MPVIDLKHHRLHYLDIGTGTPVVLLHGLGSCANHWHPQINALNSDFRIIAPDSRGHGGSSGPKGPYTIGALADDVVALLDKLNLEKVDVVGYSLGGMVGFELASYFPERLKRLVVINSGPEVPALNLQFQILFWQRWLMVHLLGMERMGKSIAKHLFPLANQQFDFQQYVDSMKVTAKGPYLATLKAFIGWSVMEHLPSITQQALVLAGDRDYTPVMYKQYYTSLMPQARLQIVANSTHATPIDQAEEVNKALLSFLRGQRLDHPAPHIALT